MGKMVDISDKGRIGIDTKKKTMIMITKKKHMKKMMEKLKRMARR